MSPKQFKDYRYDSAQSTEWCKKYVKKSEQPKYDHSPAYYQIGASDSGGIYAFRRALTEARPDHLELCNSREVDRLEQQRISHSAN